MLTQLLMLLLFIAVGQAIDSNVGPFPHAFALHQTQEKIQVTQTVPADLIVLFFDFD